MNPPLNGARSTMNSFILDGSYNTDRNTYAIVVVPPFESVQEFRIQSSLGSAEFAQSGGGVIDVVTKTGGRAFHGNAFEFLRNEATDAESYFDDPTLPRSVFRQNQYGGSLGGPLPLSSTFFFVSYEGLRNRSAKSTPHIVPDSTIRTGDFTGRSTIFDPSNLDAAGNRPGDQRIAQQWFNVNAFSDPQPYTFGNAGRNILPTPGVAIVDASLHRSFPIHESTVLEFRAEGFNILNHPNWGIPGRYPDFGPFFGYIFASGQPRRLQFGLRLEF